MIPRAITRELEKLVRSRDRYKRLAQDRAPVRSADRQREIAARDKAVETLVRDAWLYGVKSSGAFEAVQLLRPDVAKVWEDEGVDVARERFFPSPEDIE